MNECPVCDSAATDVQMARAALKATREEMERLTAIHSALRSDVLRLTQERDEWKRAVQRMVADRTYVVEI